MTPSTRLLGSSVVRLRLVTVVTADVHAKIGGVVWLAIGTAILIGLRLAGRSPELNLEA